MSLETQWVSVYKPRSSPFDVECAVCKKMIFKGESSFWDSDTHEKGDQNCHEKCGVFKPDPSRSKKPSSQSQPKQVMPIESFVEEFWGKFNKVKNMSPNGTNDATICLVVKLHYYAEYHSSERNDSLKQVVNSTELFSTITQGSAHVDTSQREVASVPEQQVMFDKIFINGVEENINEIPFSFNGCYLCYLASLHPRDRELTIIKWKDRIDGLYHANGCRNKGKKTLYQLQQNAVNYELEARI